METNQTTILTPTTTINTPTSTSTPTPTTKIQQPKPLSFSNAVLHPHHPHPYPHHHHHHHHHGVVVTYKECLKNHAASMGGHALDGCGEFMPSPNINPSNPTSLTCSACGCHRNFHRREPDEPPFPPPPTTTPLLEYQPHHRHHPPLPPPNNINTVSSHTTPPSSPSPPPISASYYHPTPPHMLLSLTNTPTSAKLLNSNARKRCRTKFTQTQKEKMVEFAERIEWKIQKRDEEMINGFCNEVGIEKGVLKVWMHNNKNKKDQNFNNNITVGVGCGGAAVKVEESSAGSYNHHHELPQLRRDIDNNGGGHVVATTITNGLGSSS